MEGTNDLGLEVMPNNSVDTEKYNGVRSKIAKAYKGTKLSDYDENSVYKEGLQREQPIVTVETDVIGETDAGEPITVKNDINLKVNPKTGNLAFSTHPKSNSAKIFAKFNVTTFEELIGKECLVVEKCNPEKPDRKWLTIQY